MARGLGGEGGARGGRDPQAGGQRDVDRARGGSGNGGFGGGRTASVIGNRFGAPSASAQAAAKARNTPAPGLAGGFNPQHFGGRRTVNPTPSYEMNLHNMMELGKMMPGPSMGLRGLGGAVGLGVGPDFTGSRGIVNGPGDYDPANRFGTMRSFGTPQAMTPNRARAAALGPVNPMVAPDWWRVPF